MEGRKGVGMEGPVVVGVEELGGCWGGAAGRLEEWDVNLWCKLVCFLSNYVTDQQPPNA